MRGLLLPLSIPPYLRTPRRGVPTASSRIPYRFPLACKRRAPTSLLGLFCMEAFPFKFDKRICSRLNASLRQGAAVIWKDRSSPLWTLHLRPRGLHIPRNRLKAIARPFRRSDFFPFEVLFIFKSFGFAVWIMNLSVSPLRQMSGILRASQIKAAEPVIHSKTAGFAIRL